MLVSDMFKVMGEKQLVDIYSFEKDDFIFSGECRDIILSCMTLEVKRVFPVNNLLLVITVE